MLINIHRLAIDYVPKYIYATRPLHTKAKFKLVFYKFDRIINRREMELWVDGVNKDHTCNFVLYDYRLVHDNIVSSLYNRRSIYSMALHAIINDKIQSSEHKEKYDKLVDLLVEFNRYENSNYMKLPINLQGARLILWTRYYGI